MEVKICSKCKKEKSITEFYKYRKVRKGKYFSSCKSCWAKLQGHNYLKETIRKCRYCKKDFIPIKSMQFHCSKECFIKHSRIRANKSHNRLRKDYKKKFYEEKIWLNEQYHKYKSKTGYIWAIFGNYVNIPEHRLIMMRKLGRKLEKWEHTHHINGIKNDNRPGNLELIPNYQHSAITKLITENENLRLRIISLEEEVNILKAKQKIKEEKKWVEEQQ